MDKYGGMWSVMDHLITLSIATKDREEVVNETLRKIYDFGLGDYPLILIDDGSTPEIAPRSLDLFPNSILIKNKEAKGQASARNRAIEICKTPYVLQLDDDSYPVGGDVDRLLEFVNRQESWLAIGLAFDEPSRGRFYRTTAAGTEQLIRAFVGCSVFINVEAFRKVKGYAEWIRGYCEEEEICLRAHSAGFQILMYDGIQIQHDVSDVSRNKQLIAARSLANWAAIYIRHAPSEILPYKLIRLFLGAFILMIKYWKLTLPKQFFSALLNSENWKSRNAMTFKAWNSVYKLPHALDVY